MTDPHGGTRSVRIAALGDLHYDGRAPGRIPEVVRAANEEADILVLCGDLTTHGEPGQIESLLELLDPLQVPTVGVLGNHEFEDGRADHATEMLNDHGITILDGDSVEIEGIGFTGVKGFAGGFGRGALGGFGEPLIKAFVRESMDEALKLEEGLRRLSTPVKVVLLHYAPIADTIEGEPEVIWPFLGSSRLLPPIDTLDADVVFHGHAHTGVLEGRTPGGVPVFNVSFPVLEALDRLLFLWDVEVPAEAEEERSSAAGRGASRHAPS